MINPLASQKIGKNGTGCDLHRAWIVAALHSKGITLAQLSRDNGLGTRTLNNAFVRPYPKAERIIAAAIGCEPADVWPSRYLMQENV
ncbi:helix-turn-helix domain-containing protein [Salmonella enterica subsp. enterica]